MAAPATLPAVNALPPGSFEALRAGRFPSGPLPLLLRDLNWQFLLDSAVGRALVSLVPQPGGQYGRHPVALLNARKGAQVDALLAPLAQGLLGIAEHDLAYGQPPTPCPALDFALHLYRGWLVPPLPDPYAAFDGFLRERRLEGTGVQRKAALYTSDGKAALSGYATLRQLMFQASVASLRFVSPARFVAAFLDEVFDDAGLASRVATPCLSEPQLAADLAQIATGLDRRLHEFRQDAARLLSMPRPARPVDARYAATERNIALNAEIGGHPGWVTPHGPLRPASVARCAVQLDPLPGGQLRVTDRAGEVVDVPCAVNGSIGRQAGYVEVIQFPSVHRVVVAVLGDSGLLATRDLESGTWNALEDLADLRGWRNAWSDVPIFPPAGPTPSSGMTFSRLPDMLDSELLDILARLSLVCGAGVASLTGAADHLHLSPATLLERIAEINGYACQAGDPAAIRVNCGSVSCRI